MEIKENFSLKSYNSWRIGGEAEFFCTPETIEECIEAHQWAEKNNHAISYLGMGSNVLISDQGIAGLVICSRKLKDLKISEENNKLKIECLAGNTKMDLLKVFLKYELSPAMMFAGIPGDIGGGIAMNAGISENISPREFHELTAWVDVLHQGSVKRFNNKDISWSYRHSEGWQPGMIVAAGFEWPLNPIDAQIKDKVKAANKARLLKQPLELPSCGSVFVNPKPHHSGQLIEESGLKGFKIGDAQVSTKHANFIVNLGSATATDIRALIEHIQDTIFKNYQIKLQTEVKFLGR